MLDIYGILVLVYHSFHLHSNAFKRDFLLYIAILLDLYARFGDN